MHKSSTIAAELIARAGATGRPLLAAIDGRSGVGKSTLARELAAATRAAVIEGDDFFAGGTGIRSDSAPSRAEACLDRPKLRAVLDQLRSGRSAAYRPFDWQAFDGSLRIAPVIIEARRVLIVEGVYASHPEFADLLDLKILLLAPDPVRHQRLIQREGSIGRWERQWHEAEDWYFSSLATPDKFDLVVGE